MNRVAVVLVSLLGLSSFASSRIWPDPGSQCRPVRVVLGPENQLAQVKIVPVRRLRMPTSLSVTNLAADTPERARLRMRVDATGEWQDCQFLRGTGAEANRFSRVSCLGPSSDEVVNTVELMASMPKGQAATLASISEVAPCANSPRSYDGKTVFEGGKFFPMTPTSSRWVAVLDEVYVSTGTLEQAAASLASQYGVSLDQLMWGPFGFSFSGSSSKAKDLSGNSMVRFVQSEVIYQGAGAVNSVVPFGAGDSWALDRLDQRESMREMLALGGGDQRYRFPESVKLDAQRPAVFVVDNAPFQAHAAFAGVRIDNIAVPGANAPCSRGAYQSDHGTNSVSALLGQLGVVRTKIRQVMAVNALGSGSGGCTAARETTIVAALNLVQSIASPGDVVSLSFASVSFSMAVEMKVNELSQRGILVFAATGNELAEQVTPPSGAAGAFAIGGLDIDGDDERWRANAGLGSNGRGGDVDYHGPADQVIAASDSSAVATVRAQGTSLAAPAIAGVGFYQVLVNGLTGVQAPMVRDHVASLLSSNSTTRTQSQIVVPFTPTLPLVGALRQIPFRIDLASTASDPGGVWLAGFQSGPASLLRIPFDNGGEPDVALTQIVVDGGSGSRCLSVATGGASATAGCWTPSLAGELRMYSIATGQNGGSVATEEAVLPLPELLPLSVAADVVETIQGSQQSTAEVDTVRTAVAVKLNGVNEWGNPLIGDSLSLVVARFGGTWGLSVVPIGSTGARYSLEVESALNCDNTNSCELYALLTRTNPSAGYPDGAHTDAVELWRVAFQTAVGTPVGQAVLLASRTDTGPFSACYVSGWAYSPGLRPVAISLDVGATGPRWSFAYARHSMGVLGPSCGFDSIVRVATTQSPADDVTVGARGQQWRAGGSRGALARTNLVLVDVWNPSSNDFDVRFLSTVRTLHPRGSAPVPSNLNRVQHSLYGDDAMGFFLGADYLTWSVARILP